MTGKIKTRQEGIDCMRIPIQYQDRQLLKALPCTHWGRRKDITRKEKSLR